MPVTQSNPERFIHLRTDRRDNGWVEIGAFVEPVIRDAGLVYVASVLRTSRSAKWHIGSQTFRTKQAAMDMLMTLSRSSAAYRICAQEASDAE